MEVFFAASAALVVAWEVFFVAWAAVIAASEAFFVARAAVIVASEAAHGDFCDLISDFFDPDGILLRSDQRLF